MEYNMFNQIVEIVITLCLVGWMIGFAFGAALLAFIVARRNKR